MGCFQSQSTRVIYKKNKRAPKAFIVTVLDPRQDNLEEVFSYETENDELPFVTVMNSLSFEEGKKGEKFDGNFISVFDEKEQKYSYFVQRLLGQEQLESKFWIPYINDVREDWSYICEHNRLIAKEDKIVWKWESI